MAVTSAPQRRRGRSAPLPVPTEAGELAVRDLAARARLDPYLLWATLTDFRDYFAPGAPRTVGVIFECLEKQSIATLEAAVQRAGLAVAFPPMYTTKDHNAVAPDLARHGTASVTVRDLPALLGLVARLELGTAIETHTTAGAMLARRTASTPVVGVIDDFVAFAHPCFAKAGGAAGSRVIAVWSQGLQPPSAIDARWWSKASPVTGYGYELANPSGRVPPSRDDLRRAYPLAMRRASHGTSVAYLAAGNGTGLPPSEADIVVVQLPRRAVADTSGGALSVQALDAIRYIVQHAGAQSPAVVNLSYATMAGPHDGTSILETAIDELVDLRDGQLAVVVPAGNAYQARSHAEILLSDDSPSEDLHWAVPPDCQTPSFLEVWLPDGAENDVDVEVVDPVGDSVLVEPGDLLGCNGVDFQGSTFGVVYLPRVANGMRGTMILIVLSPTSPAPGSAGRPLARHGRWKVTLRVRSANRMYRVEAWIERDDTLHGFPVRGRQSHFVDERYAPRGNGPPEPADTPMSLVQRQGSFNTIGTGANTIVAGGFVGDPALERVAPESGGGPLRPNAHGRVGPEVLMRTDESLVLRGVSTAGNGAVDRVRTNGTSAAAPQVTRLIEAWFRTAKGPLLVPDDIRALIAAAVCTRSPADDRPRKGAGSLC